MAAGDAQLYPSFDTHNPRQFKALIQNVRNVYHASSEDVKKAGKTWYPQVHDAVERGVRGMGVSHLGGSGLVAAVSPGMDFESGNIQAFHEMRRMKTADWETIMAHGADSSSSRRDPRVANVLRGLELGRAPDPQLKKAYRIIRGEHVDDVLNRRTAPKTNAFAHNIHEPEEEHRVTIDGRAHDLGINRMYPWTYSGRGISSAALPSGKPTRYEHFEDAYRIAAHHEGITGPQMQAVTWVQGKAMETAGLTKTGTPRKKGVVRTGQPYIPPPAQQRRR